MKPITESPLVELPPEPPPLPFVVTIQAEDGSDLFTENGQPILTESSAIVNVNPPR